MIRPGRSRRFAALLFLVAAAAGAETEKPRYPVALDGDVLFVVDEPLGTLSAAERARAAESEILLIAEDPFYSASLFRVTGGPGAATILYRDAVVTVLTAGDVSLEGAPPALAAQRAVEAVRASVRRYHARRLPGRRVRAIVLLALATVLLALALLAIRIVNRRSLRAQPTAAARRIARVLRWTASLGALFLYLASAAAILPVTRAFGLGLLGYVVGPLREIGHAFLSDVGDLFFLGVLAALVFLALRAMRWVFRQAAAGNLRLPGVSPDWAIPVYRIACLGVLAVALLIAYPYVPGSSSSAFKGLSIFAGALLTIGSSAATGNFIGGLVLMFRGGISRGDWIKVDEAVGEVIETSLTLIRLRTEKDEIVSIPNVQVLASRFVNYSTLGRERGVILHAAVTIGYEVPWRKVHALLIEAAGRTKDLEREPPPYVLQRALEKSFVAYEINAYTRKPTRMPWIYGELYEHVQDVFAAAGVEILSPDYAALRRGLPSTVPGNGPAETRPGEAP